jgi:magnesium chelatase subunit H
MKRRLILASKQTSVAATVPVKFVLLTLDAHLSGAFEQARARLVKQLPGLDLRMHIAADWMADPSAAERANTDIADANFVANMMLFTEDQAAPVLETLRARRNAADVMCCCLCTSDVMKLQKIGRFTMTGDEEKSAWSPMALLKKLRGSREDGASSGERQMKMLKQLPKLLRFIPGTAQDVRVWFLCIQYWLGASDVNLAAMIAMLINRYAAGPRAVLRGTVVVDDVAEYPETGVYHPSLPGLGVADSMKGLPAKGKAGKVGVLLGRSYLLAGNTAHYDAVIGALESQGLTVIPAYASGLDARPAIDTFFRDKRGETTIDAMVSLSGFSLVGGPAYNDAQAAQAILGTLDVPYISLQTLEFQTIDDWLADARGLNPLQATLQVAIPELDGATNPLVFGGTAKDANGTSGASQPIVDRVEIIAKRVARLVALRRTPKRDRKVAITVFNFPPNAGNTGSAAYIDVFTSLFNVMRALKADGYQVELPESVDELRQHIVYGNAQDFGAPANVYTKLSADDHVRREPYLADIEATWGPAPGRQLSDGANIFLLGERYGNVFVGVQPAFGWEGDPMRLLFEGNFAPTHAFSAYYRWLREDFGANAVLHFGTHGALEFMPGKQVGLSAACWPERLIGDLPNVYLYASNNSSEGTLAKRRGGATLVSYLTPPIANAGLYKNLATLKGTLDSYRQRAEEGTGGTDLLNLIQEQSAALDLCATEPKWNGDARLQVERVREKLLEFEYALIPMGLHVVGEGMPEQARRDTIAAIAKSSPSEVPQSELDRLDVELAKDHEIPGLLRALDARYVPPAPGGDIVRTPAVVPTGRNLYGFDPYKVPSAYAILDGRKRATQLLERVIQDGAPFPESIAFVLWGTDNMKSEGAPIAQVLALMGAAPRFDAVGRLCGARLIPLEQLGRPRVDVVITLSGIFRDLLPLQTKLLAEAALIASQADEPLEQNFIRKHTLAHMATLGCSLDEAALRVFSNADGAYGSNVNLLVESGKWEKEDELAEQFVRRKCFAYGAKPGVTARPELMKLALGGAALSFQNIDSVELGATDIDQYVESLGGMNRAIAREKGTAAPVYMGDNTGAEGKIRTLTEQVALETRTRTLNPKWFEAQLASGYEGVRNIAGHVSTTLGWSATANAVPEWVYTEVTQTFVLDPEMRERLAALNPNATQGMTQRLLEANERGYWNPDEATLDALRRANEELEDRLEGVYATA